MCLFLSGLNDIFCWYAKSCMTIKSLLSAYAEVLTQLTTENNEVSSTENLLSDVSSCGKSLTQTRENW